MRPHIHTGGNPVGAKIVPRTEGLLDVGRRGMDLLKHERDKDKDKKEKTGERGRVRNRE